MPELTVEQLLAHLQIEACDLRCINVPTGGDDFEIKWIVIEHYMSDPTERTIGQGSTALKALRSAFEKEA